MTDVGGIQPRVEGGSGGVLVVVVLVEFADGTAQELVVRQALQQRSLDVTPQAHRLGGLAVIQYFGVVKTNQDLRQAAE